MRQKTVPKSFNSIPFCFAQMLKKPERNVAERRPKSFTYHSVLFRSVPFCILRGESRGVQRHSCLSEKSRYWRAYHLTATFVCSDSLQAMNRSLAKLFPKVGVAHARLARSSSIVKAHKRNETEQNETERYQRLNRTVLPLKTGNKWDGK